MLTCGLIGCGRISQRHIWALTECVDLVTLVAVCDLQEEKADTAAQNYRRSLLAAGNLVRKPAVFADYKELLSLSPDIVIIATDSGSHYRIGVDAIMANCHTLIEKPLTMHTEDADHLVARAISHKVKLGVCHQNRFNKWVLLLRHAIDNGKFTKLYHGAATIRWNRDAQYYQAAAWRGKKETDGGVLMNQAIHNLDLLSWMLGGKPEEVFAYTANLAHQYIEMEDLAVGTVRFSNNIFATIEATTNIYPQNYEETLSIFGQTGSVTLGGKSLDQVVHWDVLDKEFAPPLHTSAHNEGIYGVGHLPLYRNFIWSVVSDTQPLCSGVQGRNSVALVEALYHSAEQKKPIALNL